MLIKENNKLKEEISNKNIKTKNFSKYIFNILKRVEKGRKGKGQKRVEKKKSEQLCSSSDAEKKESGNTPQEMVPFQFMFQDKNAINVMLIHTNVIAVIKHLTKKTIQKKHIDIDHTYSLLCEKVYPTQEW